jgi:DNA polymerase-3 subunit epsilon
VSQSIVVDPSLEKLRSLVARAREQLSEAQSEYMREKARVAAMQAELFKLVREEYQRRDTLRLLLHSRRAQLAALRCGQPEEVERAESHYQHEKRRVERDYEATASEFSGRRKLEPKQKVEIGRLWKELVKLYHPDRFSREPDKLDTYHKLTAAINKAKEAGDLTILREIADDPHAFIARQGWTELDLAEEQELTQLQRLHAALLFEITAVLDSLALLRASEDFQLCQRCDADPEGLAGIAASLAAQLRAECEALETEAVAIAREIAVARTAPVRPAT